MNSRIQLRLKSAFVAPFLSLFFEFSSIFCDLSRENPDRSRGQSPINFAAFVSIVRGNWNLDRRVFARILGSGKAAHTNNSGGLSFAICNYALAMEARFWLARRRIHQRSYCLWNFSVLLHYLLYSSSQDETRQQIEPKQPRSPLGKRGCLRSIEAN